MCKQITMNGSLKWCYVFVFVQVALCKAQYDDQIPPVFRLSTQPTSESFPQTEVKVETTTSSPGEDDLLTQLPSNQEAIQSPALDTVTYPTTPRVMSSSEPVTNEQTSAQPQVSTIVSSVSTDGNEYLSRAPSYSTSMQSPVSTVLSPSAPGTSGYSPQQASSTSIQLVGSNEETFSNSDSNVVSSEPALNHQTSPQSPISMMMTSFSNPDGSGYLSQAPSHLKTIQSQVLAVVPPPSAPGTSGYSPQQASSTSMPSVVSNTASFPTSGWNVVSSQPAMNYQLSSQSSVPTITSPFGNGYLPQQVPNYPNSMQSPTPIASSSPSASGTSDYSPAEISSHQTPMQSPIPAASPLSTPGTSGYYLPQQVPSSPYQPDMSGYPFSSPELIASATPASSMSSYYPRPLAYPPMPYGNIPYYANSYYPMQYPMAYMNPQFPYMNPQMPYMSPQMPYMSPQIPYMTPQMPYTGINPAYNQFLQPQPTNLNQTQSNRSQMPITQPPLHPQTAYAPAPNTADQSTPTVISSNGENGSDLNSLPPQVKEFIDMIPNILSMQDTSQPASQPIHPIRHPPLRKYPKTATSSLLKKKQYYTYPQYSDYPRRYGYYF